MDRVSCPARSRPVTPRCPSRARTVLTLARRTGGALRDGPPEAEPRLIIAGASNPAPRSRMSTCRRHGTSASPSSAVYRTVTQASPVPAWAATFDRASRTALEIALTTWCRDSRTGRVVGLKVDGQPPVAHSGDNGAHLPEQVAGRSHGKWHQVAGAERGLHQGHVLRHLAVSSAAASLPERATPPSVLSIVFLQQALMLRRSRFPNRMAYCSLAAWSARSRSASAAAWRGRRAAAARRRARARSRAARSPLRPASWRR